jgi:hypothetical protein
MGIPTFVLTRKDFRTIVNSAFGGLGLAPDAPSIIEFPLEMFWPGSDLTPIRENIDKIVFALTKWQPKVTSVKASTPPNIKVEGKNYAEAVDNLNLLFLRNLWGDGLPIVPATEERVLWILKGTDLPRDQIIGTILPRAGITTVEQVVVALAMAGGRPEYLPVLLAIVQAFTDPLSKHEHLQTTTGSNFPVVIVNGPITKQIRLNSGYGCLGPDPNHPAGATIGRALRLLQQCVGGAVPGSGTMSLYGANRYTNIVFAEDEDAIPRGWESLSVERGFAKGSNVVSLHFGVACIDLTNSVTSTPERLMQVLHQWAYFIGSPIHMYWNFKSRWENGAPGMVVMAGSTARGLAENGWSKDKIREFLWEESKLTPSKVKMFGIEKEARDLGLDINLPLSVSKTPKSITFIIAGGAQSGHAYFMPVQGYGLVSKEVLLPSNSKWEGLIKQAEIDLGPLPAR